MRGATVFYETLIWPVTAVMYLMELFNLGSNEEMIEPLILAGGMAFWLMSFVASCILIAFINYDKGWFAGIWSIVTVVCLSWVTSFDLIGWVIGNPWTLASYVAFYFVAGAVWAVIKWWFYLNKRKGEAQALKQIFLTRQKLPDNTIPVEMKDKFREYVADSYEYHDRDYPPQASRHKSDWMFWASYWPFSFVWTMLDEPIKKAWLFIYNKLGNMMQRMSDTMFKDI